MKTNDLKKYLYFYSINIEKKQINFLKNKQKLRNIKTGEIYSLNYDLYKKQKEYVKTLEQKTHALNAIASAQNLQPIFCTLTLPSEYHPYRTLNNKKVIKNKNYQYKALDNSITQGYQYLKEIYRVFYKRIKNISKNIYYIKVTEPHKSLIPHMHIMLFVPKNQIINIQNTFYKVCQEYKLQRVEFDESFITDNINNATGYIMKYILKTINSKDDFFKRWIDGWRKKYKIRACEMSNLPINIEVYKKLYYNLPKDIKQSIQKSIEENNQSFFEYFINNTKVHQIIYKEDTM